MTSPSNRRTCARCGESMSNHDKWRFEHDGQACYPVHRICEWPGSRMSPEEYRLTCGEGSYQRMKGLLFHPANHRPQYAVNRGDEDVPHLDDDNPGQWTHFAPDRGTKTPTPAKAGQVALALSLPQMLEDGQPLRNLKGHALRIAFDIKKTAEETGGDPLKSARYLDATAIVSLVGDFEDLADGSFSHRVVAVEAQTHTQRVLQQVEREREAQVRKGYTPEHDDEHGDEKIAHEAAITIWPVGPSAPRCPEGGEDWVDPKLPRRDELIKGIALAVAEVERLDRAAERELLR